LLVKNLPAKIKIMTTSSTSPNYGINANIGGEAEWGQVGLGWMIKLAASNKREIARNDNQKGLYLQVSIIFRRAGVE
jgi:hypothetical protein